MRIRKDIKLNKDWWSDDQGDIHPGMTRDGVLYTKFKGAKDCKKTTPDQAYKTGDVVRLLFDVKSYGFGYDVPKGDYIFDSFDSYDNTCFIKKDKGYYLDGKYKPSLCYNVSLNMIKRLIVFKTLTKKKKK